MTKGNPQLHSDSAEQLMAQIAAELGKPRPGGRWNAAAGSVLGGSVQLFGRLSHILIHRLNEAPEQHFRAFLNAAEIDRLPPRPAYAEITFLPAPDGPPVIHVPKGTQIATRPAGDQPEVIFETERAIVVTPAALAACISVDAANSSDRTREARGEGGSEEINSFRAFAGDVRRERILYLGDDLFVFPDKESRERGTVSIRFSGAAGGGEWPLRWFGFDGEGWKELPAGHPTRQESAAGPDGPTFDIVYTLAGLPDLPEAAVKERKGHWLAAQLTELPPGGRQPSLTDIEVQQHLVIGKSRPRKADGALAAIQGGKLYLPLDPLNAMQPFGPQPTTMDAFYLRLDDVLQKEGALVTLSLALPGLPAAVQDAVNLDKLKIAWEYYCSREVSGEVSGDGVKSRVEGWELLGTSGRGCPELEALEIDLTPFPKPLLRSNTLARKKYLEYSFPPGYDQTRLPPEFAGGKLKTDIYTGERFIEIEVPDGCKDLPDDILINGCSTPEPLHPEFKDKTCAFTSSGKVLFRVPKAGEAAPHFVPAEINGQMGYWLRARLVEGSYNEPRSVRQGLGQRIDLPPLVHAPIIAQLEVSFAGYDATTPARRVGQCLAKTDGRWRNLQPSLAAGPQPAARVVRPFSGRVELPALYLGFLALDGNILRPPLPANELLELSVEVVERDAPSGAALLYEYWNGSEWRLLRSIDETANLRHSGSLRFYAPADHAPSDEFGRPAWWLRVRAAAEGVQPAADLGAILLNTVSAVNAQTVRGELLGSSSGKPGQSFALTRSPVLPDLQIQVHEREAGSAAEAIDLAAASGAAGGAAGGAGNAANAAANAATNGAANGAGNGVQSHDTWVDWERADSFYECGPDSRCYMLDQAAGVVTFGDGKNGRIPPPGSDNIRALVYRTHRGRGGNVPAGAITDLRSPQGGLGSIDRVTNRAPSAGGGDAEGIDGVRRRGPQLLRHRGRAVTQEDYQWLGLEIDGVARVYPLPAVNPRGDRQGGWVTLVVVPQGPDATANGAANGTGQSGAAYAASQELPPALKRVVRTHLEQRILANLSTTAPRAPDGGMGGAAPDGLHLRAADFMQVCVAAAIVVKDVEAGDAVKLDVIKQLEAFLHPLSGGPQRTGWVLGRDVYLSEVAAEIESVPGVDHVVRIELSAPNLQHWQLTVRTANGEPLAQEFGVGSQVCLIDERVRLMLAQPLAATAPPPCRPSAEGDAGSITRSADAAQGGGLIPAAGAPITLAIYGFKVGDSVTLLDTRAQTGEHTGEQIVTIGGLDLHGGLEMGKSSLHFARSFDLPPGEAQQYAVQSADGRLRLPVAAWITPDSSDRPDGRKLVTGAVVSSFTRGDLIALVHSQVRRRMYFPLAIDAITVGSQQHLYVPESYLVCSGSHTVTLGMEGA